MRVVVRSILAIDHTDNDECNECNSQHSTQDCTATQPHPNQPQPSSRRVRQPKHTNQDSRSPATTVASVVAPVATRFAKQHNRPIHIDNRPIHISNRPIHIDKRRLCETYSQTGKSSSSLSPRSLSPKLDDPKVLPSTDLSVGFAHRVWPALEHVRSYMNILKPTPMNIGGTW